MQERHLNKVIALANQKGGVGKTTTSVNLAACIAQAGYDVLLIDMDPQGNASSGVGFEREQCERSIYHAMTGELTLDEVIHDTDYERLKLIPSTTDLAGVEIELVEHPEREFVLFKTLGTLQRKFDFILLDCPPSLGLLTVNSLVASTSVLVPIQTEYYALEGLGHLLHTIGLIQEHLNPRLTIEGILLTMYDARTNLSEQVAGEVVGHFEGLVFQTVIPRNVRLSEAPSFGQPIIAYDGGSRGAKSYQDFTREFLARNGLEPIESPPAATPETKPDAQAS
jgi:chromosome partitioning protein